MGLLTSVNNLNYTLEEEKKAKKLEKIQKQKEKIRKEDLIRYKKELENFIKIEFTKYFSIAGTSYIYEFYNRERKKEILNGYFMSIRQVDAKNYLYIPFKLELEEHFYKKYNTILNNCYKEQQQQEKYNIIMESKHIENTNKKEISDKNLVYTFKIIGICVLSIVCFPIAILLMIILAAIKGMK